MSGGRAAQQVVECEYCGQNESLLGPSPRSAEGIDRIKDHFFGNRLDGFSLSLAQFTWLKPGVNEIELAERIRWPAVCERFFCAKPTYDVTKISARGRGKDYSIIHDGSSRSTSSMGMR